MATVKIAGMSCNHCVQSVTKALSAINGIENVLVSLEKKEANYSEKEPVSKEIIKAAITRIGFQVVE